MIFAHRGNGEASTGSNYSLYEALRGLWKRSFVGSTDVLGKTVTVNGVPLTIIGVPSTGVLQC